MTEYLRNSNVTSSWYHTENERYSLSPFTSLLTNAITDTSAFITFLSKTLRKEKKENERYQRQESALPPFDLLSRFCCPPTSKRRLPAHYSTASIILMPSLLNSASILSVVLCSPQEGPRQTPPSERSVLLAPRMSEEDGRLLDAHPLAVGTAVLLGKAREVPCVFRVLCFLVCCRVGGGEREAQKGNTQKPFSSDVHRHASSFREELSLLRTPKIQTSSRTPLGIAPCWAGEEQTNVFRETNFLWFLFSSPNQTGSFAISTDEDASHQQCNARRSVQGTPHLLLLITCSNSVSSPRQRPASRWSWRTRCGAVRTTLVTTERCAALPLWTNGGRCVVLPAVGVSAAVGRRRDEEGEDTCVFTAQLDKMSVRVRMRMREIICVCSQCVTCVEFVLLCFIVLL